LTSALGHAKFARMAGSSGARIFAYVLLAVAIVISFQGWRNAQVTSASTAMAKDHACDLDSSCIVLDDQPRVGRADVIRHRYEFKTTHGMMTVTCKRQLLFFGPWSCTVAEGRLVSDPIP
jgi:CTP:molybdopterin cytidylyltransferase MocA